MFDLKQFLIENKLTRNSILLENYDSPSFTEKEMRLFKSEDVTWDGELDNRNMDPVIIYKGHRYILNGPEDIDIIDHNRGENYSSGDLYKSTNKIPGVWFKFSANFDNDGDGWSVYEILELENIEIDASWEIDPDSDELPDEEEFSFDENKNIKNIKEMKGDELTNTINMIGGTLSKVNNMMDFGIEQSPEVSKGLDTVLSILINIQDELERNGGSELGPSKDYYLENILKK